MQLANVTEEGFMEAEALEQNLAGELFGRKTFQIETRAKHRDKSP